MEKLSKREIDMAISKVIGAAVKRIEDPRLITGSGTYVDDMTLPRMAYAAVLRSNYAHARIKKIDVSKALRQQGVLKIITGSEITGLSKPIPSIPISKGMKHPVKYPLAVNKVLYVGDPVAVVAAESKYAAVDAAELIEVEYDPLPAVTDPEKAMEESSPVIHDEFGENISYVYEIKAGDVERAFRDADKIVKERYTIQRLAPSPMETRGVVASYEAPGGFLTVWSSTQTPHILRTELSKILNFPENRIRVIAPDVGGGFGSKSNLYSEEVLTCILSIYLGRPVKWIEERKESFQTTAHGRDQIDYMEAAVRNDGTILGIKSRIIADLGSYFQMFTPGVPKWTPLMLPGPYKVPNIHVQLYGVFTNKMATDAYRGAGRPEATYLLERLIESIARELKMEPVDVRMKNFIKPEEFPYLSPTGYTYDSGNYQITLEKALAEVDYRSLRREQEALRKQGRYIGVGLSFCIEICGFGPSKDMGGAGYEVACVRLDPSGKVTVLTGSSDHGQGHGTTFAQIVADELGVSFDDVVVLHGDTGRLAYGIGTFGSRSVVVGGTAVLMASRKIKEKAVKIASSLLEARVEDLVYEGGRIFVKGASSKSVSIKDVAAEAYGAASLPEGVEPGLEAISFYDPENYTFPFGAHVAVVEVDPSSGQVKILRYVAVDDCGVVVNPVLVDGQVHGGAAQAIAQALYEEVIYSEDGQLVNSSFMDYHVPTAVEIPRFETLNTVTPAPNPLGAKGIGELATIAGTACVVNAVTDALAPFVGKLNDMPIRPEAIWRITRRGKLRPA